MCQILAHPLTIYLISILLSAVLCHFLVVWILQKTGFYLPPKDDSPQFSLWVGVFERIVVTMLVLGGALSTTPFIFATKVAVMTFRIPSDSERKKFSEYVIIGTLVSYVFALAVGILGLYFLQHCKV